MSPDPVRHANTIIFPASLDPQAVSVVRRLREAGYESYLVGGCVRDLLLGHIPKDFDASTEARPRQIRRVFRNCRIIGRRFKLAHVHFGNHIIEVATFRKNPSSAGEHGGSSQLDTSSEEAAPAQEPSDGESEHSHDSDDLLITRDNVYGTAEEDTLRRDFTINALLYDVLTDEVIDYVGGVKDVDNKILRTIGDPSVRIAEDPVRMLRAVKFTARLGLEMDPALDAAMHASAEQIDRSAPPRVLEEIYKMMTCGAASRALEMLLDFGLFERLLPELAEHWTARPEECKRLGAALDHVDRAKRGVDNSFVLAMLFHDVWRRVLSNTERMDPLVAARDLLAPAALRMNIPRRDVAAATQMMLNQSRLERTRRGRRFRMKEFLARDTTVLALDLLYVRSLAGLADPECHARWCMRLAEHYGNDAVPGHPVLTSTPTESTEPPRKRRRRRSGRRRGSSSTNNAERSREQPEKAPSEPKESGPQRRRTSRGATETGHQSSRPSQTSATKPAEPKTETAAASVGTNETSGGFAGRLKGFLRRVVGRSSSQDNAGTSSPAGSTGQSESAPPGSSRARSDSQQASSRDAKKPSGHEAEAGTPTTAGGPEQGEGAARTGRRRPRRRRRRGGRGRNGRTPEKTEAKTPTTTDSGSERPADAPSEGGTESKRRPSRRRNTRGGSSKNGSGNSGRSNGRRGGRSSGSDHNKPSRPNSTDSTSQPNKPKPEKKEDSGRHPEDVEDIFDW